MRSLPFLFVSFAGAAVITPACMSSIDDAAPSSMGDENASLHDDTRASGGANTSCSGLAAPSTPSCCSSCSASSSSCQPNGCYGGYACATATCHCQPMPSTCGSGSSTTSSATSSGGSTSSSTSSSGSGGAGGADGGSGDDGTPTRKACTSNFGSGLSASFGRLDGYLVSIVPPGSQHACNADTGHVHLQIRVASSVYDVAVNTDTLYDVLAAPLPGAAWSEGWHTGQSLDYSKTLGVHSSAFQSASASTVAQTIEDALASANHLSIFATGYGADGAHEVHRNDSGTDGAIVIDPLSSSPHLLLFRFTSQSF